MSHSKVVFYAEGPTNKYRHFGQNITFFAPYMMRKVLFKTLRVLNTHVQETKKLIWNNNIPI